MDELEEEPTDESQEYNYYTDSEDEEGAGGESTEGEEDELTGYFRLRAFLALMLPISMSASIGAFLLR